METMKTFDSMLIDEYSNYFLTAFITVFNRLVSSEEHNKKSFIKAIRKEADDNQYYFTNEYLEDLFKESELIISHDESYLKPCKNKKIPYCMTAAEKIYLKGILNSRYARIILKESTIEETMKYLKKVPDIGFDRIFQFAGTRRRDYISEEEITNIRIVLKAIQENKALKYSNKARNGHEFIDKTCFPIRIEYSVMNDEFSASVWSPEEKRPVRLLLSTLYDVKIGNRIWEEKLSPQEMMQKHLKKEPLIVEINNEKNAIERFQFAFSMYDKRTEMIDENKARVKIYYYDFDKNEIINNMMSFGPTVKIISPTNMIDALREKLYQDSK